MKPCCVGPCCVNLYVQACVHSLPCVARRRLSTGGHVFSDTNENDVRDSWKFACIFGDDDNQFITMC